MLDFDEIWKQFDYVVKEMRDCGMCFFEGFILSLSNEKIHQGVRSLCGSPLNADLSLSTWSDGSTKEDREKTYSTDQYVELFDRGKISTLQLEYHPIQNDVRLHIKLMIEKWYGMIIAEIICFREPILASSDPKQAVYLSVLEFLRLKALFVGSSLFIGPDTLNYPESDDIYPEEWIKLA